VSNVVLLVVGMTAVTYVPRLIPLMMSGRHRLGPWQRRTMSLVPITAVGALLVPGGLSAVDGRVDLSAIGIVAAVAITVTLRQPFLVVVGSVAAVALAITLGL